MKNKMIILGFLILAGCNSPSDSPSTGTTDSSPTTFTGPQYGGHTVFVGEIGGISVYTPDSRTGALISGAIIPVLSNGNNGSQQTNCSVRLSLAKKYLFSACNSADGFQKFTLTPSIDYNYTLISNYISGNYNADGISLDASGNIFIHHTKNISPYDEKTAKFTFNETTNVVAYVGLVTTTGIPDMTPEVSGDLLDLTYMINTQSDRVDMYQNGSLTSYSAYTSQTPLSIVVK